VTPNGPISYQWYRNTSNSNTGGTLIYGAINASFEIPAALTAGTYYYYCEINSPGAEPVTSNVATVTVNRIGCNAGYGCLAYVLLGVILHAIRKGKQIEF
jgi:hypothetical protein